MPQSTPSISVVGPEDKTTGFIRDFLSQTNEHEDFLFIAGDVLRVRSISCEGYVVEPVTLLSYRPEDPRSEYTDEDSEIWNHAGRGRVELTPESSLLSLTPSQLTVSGITDVEGTSPLSLSLLTDDPFAPNITFDTQTGKVVIETYLLSEYDDIPEELPRSTLILPISRARIDFLSSPFLSDVWQRHAARPATEGIVYADGVVPKHLSELLHRQISELASVEPIDWHPGSHNHVRDLVHPSLFPYVDGESPLNDAGLTTVARVREYERTMANRGGLDRWGRRYEASKYQWLPTIFRTKPDGAVTIEGYINNLDRTKYIGLYESLARLFEIFLPRFEAVYAYAQAVRFIPEEEDDMISAERNYRPDLKNSLLRGTALRVITKIVDYELRAENDYVDGVYHVEGMSSDHIILTGIYILHRDKDFNGADLEFQRAFLDFEGGAIFGEISQVRHWKAERLVDEGVRPLGTLKTPAGRMIVFPNSHIHKLSRMTRALSADQHMPSVVSRRRVIIFWVVDPDREVLTTQHVPRQQETMPLEKALEHRLALMEERKRQKGKLNGERKISLCEH